MAIFALKDFEKPCKVFIFYKWENLPEKFEKTLKSLFLWEFIGTGLNCLFFSKCVFCEVVSRAILKPGCPKKEKH